MRFIFGAPLYSDTRAHSRKRLRLVSQIPTITFAADDHHLEKSSETSETKRTSLLIIPLHPPG